MLRQALSALLLMTVAPILAQVPIQHAPDGGSQLHVQSIDVPPIANSPFSANVVTELTTIMPDGSKATLWNHRLIARDSSGRVLQERRWFDPHGDTQETRLGQLQYDDPNLQEMTVCDPGSKTCRVYKHMYNTSLPNQSGSLPPKLTLANGSTIESESLGHNTVQGLDCLGSRQITTIPGGVVGAEKPQPVVKEFWYAPNLGVNLITKRFDPRVSSIQNFTVTQLIQSEPDRKIFLLPEGFTVVR
jgi:hypothetical protein